MRREPLEWKVYKTHQVKAPERLRTVTSCVAGMHTPLVRGRVLAFIYLVLEKQLQSLTSTPVPNNGMRLNSQQAKALQF